MAFSVNVWHIDRLILPELYKYINSDVLSGAIILRQEVYLYNEPESSRKP